jgi:hypothetical protein
MDTLLCPEVVSTHPSHFRQFRNPRKDDASPVIVHEPFFLGFRNEKPVKGLVVQRKTVHHFPEFREPWSV